jgi:rhodanese-related sulfurtransferase
MGTQCSSPKPESNAQTEAQKEVSIKEQVANGAFLVDVRTPQEFAEEV